MTDQQSSAKQCAASGQAERDPKAPANGAEHVQAPGPRSMHEGIAVWEGCGSCGAEPYWIEMAEEMGMALGSDDDEGADERDTPTSSPETQKSGGD